MNEADKKLLLKDLCGRVPYGVKCRQFKLNSQICTLSADLLNTIENIEPYLRPLSSMTEDEEIEFAAIGSTISTYGAHNYFCILNFDGLDWLNSHHFDYRGLIEKGLALEAPKDMYKTE